MYYGLIDAMFYKQGVSMLFTHCPGTAFLHAGEVVARIPPNDYGKSVAEKSASALMDLHKPKAEHKVVRVKNWGQIQTSEGSDASCPSDDPPDQ